MILQDNKFPDRFLIFILIWCHVTFKEILCLKRSRLAVLYGAYLFELYLVCVFSCTVLFVSQVIGCGDRLRNDVHFVGRGVKLYCDSTCSLLPFTSTSPFITVTQPLILPSRGWWQNLWDVLLWGTWRVRLTDTSSCWRETRNIAWVHVNTFSNPYLLIRMSL